MTLELSDDRWMVVDRNRTPIYTGMFRRENAQAKADRLNDEPLPDDLAAFRPYAVVLDVVSMELGS